MSDDDKPKAILLGEAPSKGGDAYHHFPLSGPPARVLCTMADIPPQEGGSTYGQWTWALYEAFDCRNLIERYRDATPWRVGRARACARELLDTLGAPDSGEFQQAPVIVCLGRKVQKAIGEALDFDAVRLQSRAYGGWGSPGAGLFGNYGTWAAPWQIEVPTVPASGGPAVSAWAPWLVTIPHPSGLNRLLNDAEVRARCGAVLTQARALAASGGTVKPWTT